MHINNMLDNNAKEIQELLETIEKINQNLHNKKRQKPTLYDEIFLDNNELCQMLHLSTRTLQDYRDKGIISFYKLEGKILYKLSDIHKMLENNYYKAWKYDE